MKRHWAIWFAVDNCEEPQNFITFMAVRVSKLDSVTIITDEGFQIGFSEEITKIEELDL